MSDINEYLEQLERVPAKRLATYYRSGAAAGPEDVESMAYELITRRDKDADAPKVDLVIKMLLGIKDRCSCGGHPDGGCDADCATSFAARALRALGVDVSNE